MIKKAILIVMILLTIFMNSRSQTIQKSDSIIRYEKAMYLKEDLTKFLSINTKYPKEEMMDRIMGDVVFSFIINKSGKLVSLALESLPNISFLNSAKTAINSLDGEWRPTMINNAPEDRKYLIVFRFRTYLDYRPDDYKSQARRLFEKQKYERALKLYNKGVKDNRYDFELFEFRSKVKEMLGDIEGAKTDQSISLKLKDEIMSIIDVTAIGVTRTIRKGERIVSVPQER
jgi:tetratricopeptide (TPR) repeat protein